MNKPVPSEFETNKDRIDIWHVDLSLPAFDRPDLLSQDETLRSEKMLHTENRKLFIRSRCALRTILARCLSLATHEPSTNEASTNELSTNKPLSNKLLTSRLAFQYGVKGKPSLSIQNNTPLEFNLSHSHDIALIAVALHRQIGIDISHTNRSTNWESISKRSFTESEQASLLQAENPQEEFHRIWSQKEAYTKALGLGFSYGFRNFSVKQNGGLIQDSIDPDAPKKWTIKCIATQGPTVAALAFNGAFKGSNPATIHLWKLDPAIIPPL